jgi:hypothetical protein
MMRRVGWTLVVVLLALAMLVPVATAFHRRAPVNHKRGVGSTWYLWFGPKTLTHVGASWAYDWSTKAPKRVKGLEWVPMVWGRRSVTPATLRALRSYARSKRARYLLTFNEPDLRSQAHMTVAQAVALWPALEKTGLKLGAPAPAIWFDKWLPQFMAQARARHLRVDFIDVHFYPDFTSPNAVAKLRRQLVAIHNLYHRPIWVTEIGTLDIRRFGERMKHPPTWTAAVRYLRRAVALLDSLPFVQRYAWFTDRCWHEVGCQVSGLFSDGRGRETALGRAFATAR